jgi:hypothetical protein
MYEMLIVTCGLLIAAPHQKWIKSWQLTSDAGCSEVSTAICPLRITRPSRYLPSRSFKDSSQPIELRATFTERMAVSTNLAATSARTL